jgi:TRAP-type C4-dicarboxylate transport system substrate-binding protein
MRKLLLAGVAALALGGAALGSATTAKADTYSLSTWLEPSHIITKKAHVEWAQEIEKASKGKIKFEVYMGEALLPAKATLQGVADGVAQVGFHTATYTPSDLPVMNALADLAFKLPDAMAAAFASTEMVFTNKALNDEWTKHGVVYGGGYATPVYHFLCRGEVKSAADLKGKRVRMPGGAWPRFGQELGSVSVNIPSSEIYTAFDRRSVDCTASDLTHINTGATLWEVIDSVTLINMGPFFAGTSWIYNKDFWQGLGEQDRRLLLDESARALVRLQVAYDEGEKAALDFFKQKGKKVVEADASLEDAKKKFIANDLGGSKDLAKSKYGVADPAALFGEFEAKMAKWQDLLKDVDRKDEAKLVALVRAEIYDKVDAKGYGVK